MPRLGRLARATTALTFLLVTVGGLVRATDSGDGCPDWPTCYGKWIPPADHHAIIEWSHRFLAQLVGWGVVAVAVAAVLWHRRDKVTLRLGVALLPLVMVQAGLGAYVVHTGLRAWTVVAHLGVAMVFVACLLVLSTHLSRPPSAPREGDRALARLLGLGALGVYALLLVGSYVTGRHAGLSYRDWPLMGGRVVPEGLDELAPLLHFGHRLLALAVGLLLAYVVVQARRRGSAPVRRLVTVAGALFAAEVVVGGLNVFSRLHSAVVTTHLALGALIWGAVVTAWALARPAAATPAAAEHEGEDEAEAAGAPAPARTVRQRVMAYVALTKPRIIELLLVTTIPTMVVAARGWPDTGLVVATLVGGTLAAGGANAVNMYLDRDIDKIMKRTRNRPLATGVIEPRHALVFAVALEAVAAAELWLLVNPLSAALAVSATLFYVFVYTIWLKRSSTQNIVIGGAAGAVPVLVGWAAVTNSLGLAPLVLFAIIFAWTPPHFWALAIRYRDDYEAASIPMLPVVKPYAETARQIVLYTVVLWAVTLAFYPVGRMGEIYLAAAILLGGVFTYRATRLLRREWSRETAALAMGLFGWSITYVVLLFGAMALDQLVLPSA